MYTVFTKEIDGLTVILGLDTEKLDPIKTNIKIKPLIETCQEFKAKKSRLDKVAILTTANNSLFRQGRVIAERVSKAKGISRNELKESDFSSGEQNSLNNYNSKMIKNNDELQANNLELIDCEKNLKKKISEIKKEHGVFFELTNEYENRISDSDYKDFSGKLKQIHKKKMFLSSDGSIIIDNRNKTFYGLFDGAWDKLEIKKLGEVFDSGIYKLFEDLTEEEKSEINVQFESDRIDGLSAEDRELEKNAMLESAMNKSVNERSKLEILGDSDALVKAQELYNSEKIVIEERYAI